MIKIRLKNLPPGAIVRRKPNSRTAYIRGPYNRAAKRHEMQDFYDIGRFILLSGETYVYPEITF